VYFGVHAAWNYRRAEVEKWKLQAWTRAVRLDALNLQLNPHFFFNSLASVRSLVTEAPGRARKMISRLARLLRTTLRADDVKSVPLSEELSMVGTYLKLEKVRFEERLDWAIEVSDPAREREVPFLLVQTLVENAVKHGVATRRKGGTISVRASVESDEGGGGTGQPSDRDGGLLRLRVTNPGTVGEGGEGTVTGLENARERLRLLFGEAASLELRQIDTSTVAATAWLPSPRSVEATGVLGTTAPRPLGSPERETDALGSVSAGRAHPASDRAAAGEAEPMSIAHASSSPNSEESSPEWSTRFLLGSPAYWLCQIAGWGTLVVLALLSSMDWDQSWGLFLTNFVKVLGLASGLGILLTHGVRIFAKWRGWMDLKSWRLAPRVVLAALVLGGSYVLALSPRVLPRLLPEGLPVASGAWIRAALAELAPATFSFSVIMGIWLAIYFAVHAAWNSRQAEIEKWKLQARAEAARLDALKLQLNPHFFFNSLASVRALVAEDPRRAATMITRLARLLRTTLRADEAKTVPLSEELSTVSTYLKLEKVRFEDRLDWTIEVSGPARECEVPFLLVQTLVENAVKHGVATRREGGTISINASVQNARGGDGQPTDHDEGALRLWIENPGTLGGGEEGTGTGLRNARERLHLLFGGAASLTLAQSAPNTVTATARFPSRTAPIEPTFSARSTLDEDPA
jgi:LytS/YehU family sensor histidine kinase